MSPHLVEVDDVAEPAQPLDLLGGQRQRRLVAQRAPLGPGEVDVGSRLRPGRWALRGGEVITVHCCGCLTGVGGWGGSRWQWGLGGADGGNGRPAVSAQVSTRSRVARDVRTVVGCRRMCGIVGYVGGQSALDVVIAGLKRLEYRGYDSAGVAVLADGGLAAAKKAGKLVNLEKALAGGAAPRRGTTGIGHTRWATHGGADRRQRPPAPGQRRAGRGRPQRDHRELRRAAGRAGRARATSSPPRPTPRSSRTCSPRSYSAAADLAEAMRQVCRRLEGAFTLVAVHADEPDVVVGARRNSPLVVGRRRGGDLPRLRRRRVHRAHPLRRSSWARTRWSSCAATAVTVTDFDGSPAETPGTTTSTGTPRPPRRAATTTSCSRRSPSSRRPSPTRCSAGSARTGSLTLDEVRIPDAGAARGRQGRRRRLRDRLPRRA